MSACDYPLTIRTRVKACNKPCSASLLWALIGVLLLMTWPVQSEEVFRVSISRSPANPITKVLYSEWTVLLKEQSEGRLAPKLYIGSAVVSPREGITALRDNLVDVGFHTSSYTPSEAPLHSFIEEFSLKYSNTYATVLAAAEFNIFDEEQSRRWLDDNIVYGAPYATGAYRIICREPVKTLADLKGKRLRSPVAFQAKWIKGIGAVPVSLVVSEQLPAIERGILDCTITMPSEHITSKLWEVAPYTLKINMGAFWSGFGLAFNSNFWAGLAPIDRRVILDVTAFSLAKHLVDVHRMQEEGLAESIKQGGQVFEPDEALLRSLTDFVKDYEEEAFFVGREIYGIDNPVAVIGRFNRLLSKWENILSTIDIDDVSQLEAVIKANIYDRIDETQYGLK